MSSDTATKTNLSPLFVQVRYRYYHPLLGCWLTRDPIGYHFGSNIYQYVSGRCITLTDAFGLFDLIDGGGIRVTMAALKGIPDEESMTYYGERESPTAQNGYFDFYSRSRQDFIDKLREQYDACMDVQGDPEMCCIMQLRRSGHGSARLGGGEGFIQREDFPELAEIFCEGASIENYGCFGFQSPSWGFGQILSQKGGIYWGYDGTTYVDRQEDITDPRFPERVPGSPPILPPRPVQIPKGVDGSDIPGLYSGRPDSAPLPPPASVIAPGALFRPQP